MEDVRTWIDRQLDSVSETRICVHELARLKDKAAKWDRELEARRDYVVELKPDGSVIVESIGGSRRRISLACDPETDARIPADVAMARLRECGPEPITPGQANEIVFGTSDL